VWTVSTLAGGSAIGFPYSGSFSDGTGTAALFYFPSGVAADTSGVLYVADRDNMRIRVVSFSGSVSTLAGSGKSMWADGTGTAASFLRPRSVATYPGSGIIYVADANRIRKLTRSGVVKTFAGSDNFYAVIDGQDASAAFGSSITQLTVDSVGVVYVVDSARIRKITPLGAVTTLGDSGFGLAVDGSSGNVVTLYQNMLYPPTYYIRKTLPPRHLQ